MGRNFTDQKEREFTSNYRGNSSYPSSSYRCSTVFPTSTKYPYLDLCKVPVFIALACSLIISDYEGMFILSCSKHFSNSSCHPLWTHLAQTLLQGFSRLLLVSGNRSHVDLGGIVCKPQQCSHNCMLSLTMTNSVLILTAHRLQFSSIYPT